MCSVVVVYEMVGAIVVVVMGSVVVGVADVAVHCWVVRGGGGFVLW